MIPKSPDNFRIIHKDGTEFDMAEDLSILVHSLKIHSLIPNIFTEKIEGRNGLVRLSKDYDQRRLTAICSLYGQDYLDYQSLLDKLYQVLYPDEPFYLIVDGKPNKRWVVEVSNEWTPERVGSFSEFQIELVSFSSFSESVQTTIERPAAYITGGRTISYKHSTASFEIYNDGDEEIDPRAVPLQIIFKGASTNLKITNTTTGEEWTYTGSSNVGDTITLDGIRAIKNGLSIFGDTNKKLISIAKGWNQFEINGANGEFEISFDFRSYYKH